MSSLRVTNPAVCNAKLRSLSSIDTVQLARIVPIVDNKAFINPEMIARAQVQESGDVVMQIHSRHGCVSGVVPDVVNRSGAIRIRGIRGVRRDETDFHVFQGYVVTSREYPPLASWIWRCVGEVE